MYALLKQNRIKHVISFHSFNVGHSTDALSHENSVVYMACEIATHEISTEWWEEWTQKS